MAYCGKMEKKIKKLTDEIKDDLEKAFRQKDNEDVKSSKTETAENSPKDKTVIFGKTVEEWFTEFNKIHQPNPLLNGKEKDELKKYYKKAKEVVEKAKEENKREDAKDNDNKKNKTNK